MKHVFSAIGLRGSVLALVLTLSALSAGCKQGEGDTCQINNDCSSGLVCNPGTMQCQKPGTGSPDAAPPPDARRLIDATATDADTADADTTDADTTDADTTDADTTDAAG